MREQSGWTGRAHTREASRTGKSSRDGNRPNRSELAGPASSPAGSSAAGVALVLAGVLGGVLLTGGTDENVARSEAGPGTNDAYRRLPDRRLRRGPHGRSSRAEARPSGVFSGPGLVTAVLGSFGLAMGF